MRARVARTTGALVVLYDGRLAEIDAGERWIASCEDHATIVSSRTRRLADASLSHPEEWCDGCQRALEVGEPPEGGLPVPTQG